MWPENISLIGEAFCIMLGHMDRTTGPPKFAENSFLVVAGLLAIAPLCYQLPRLGHGLDPTFVHPDWIERSSFPWIFHMATLPPLFWTTLAVLAFIRICRNYGWKLDD